MNLNEHHYRVLAALRAATVLRREPGPVTPDGYERFHLLESLATAGLLTLDAHAEAAAEGLRKNRLVVRRVIHTRRYFMITSDALVLLARLEAAAGMSDVISAELDMAQAREDAYQAREREKDALRRLAEASLRLGGVRPSAAEIVAGQEATRNA